jgi:hypothetical protein
MFAGRNHISNVVNTCGVVRRPSQNGGLINSLSTWPLSFPIILSRGPRRTFISWSTNKNNRLLELLLTVACCLILIGARPLKAQIRGQYESGLNATNSGTLAPPGLTYANLFQLYSFNQAKDGNGIRHPITGNLSVLFDHNILNWTTKETEHGMRYAFIADILFSSNSLTIVDLGSLRSGAGITDTYIQPLTLGWKLKRADIQIAYGFIAPTGRFKGGADDNAGSGYWGNDISSGQTVHLTKNKRTAFSAYEMYEFHGTQRDTHIHPGQTINLDYSLMQIIPLQKNKLTLLQLGLVGYEQHQTTDKSGPTITPEQASTRYRVNAMGGAANIILPGRKAAISFKALKEFGNRSTVQGYSIQIGGAITF